jgi:hypothetical protein
MAIFAVVNPSGGVVSNIVVGGDLQSVTEFVGGAVEITESTGNGGIGYIWDAETGKFTLPEA